MKTRPSNPTGSSFPTCGEVYQYFVNQFDLLAWSDAFQQSDKSAIKKLSNQLSVWAKEKESIPSRGDFENHLKKCIAGMPSCEALGVFLPFVLNRLLDSHSEIILNEATFLPEKETRHWFGKRIAPSCIIHLYGLQLLLRRVVPHSRLLQLSPDELLSLLGTMESKCPLTSWCFRAYSGSAQLEREGRGIDPKAIRDWEQGKSYPKLDSLSRYFAGHDHMEALVLDFAFARLIERAFHGLMETVESAQERDTLVENLVAQAQCLKMVEGHLAENRNRAGNYSNDDYLGYIGEVLGQYFDYMNESLRKLDQGQCILGENDQFHCYRQFSEICLSVDVPERFQSFAPMLSRLEKASRLSGGGVIEFNEGLTKSLQQLRKAFPEYKQVLGGPLLAIEARLVFSNPTVPVKERLENAYRLYLSAVAESRYRAGAYTKRIYREALGVSAFLHHRKLSQGSILPQISRLLAWWDLIGLGDDYRHEHEERRAEKAEGRFLDMISEAHREQLRSAFPDIVIPTRLFGGIMSLGDPNHPDISDNKVPRAQTRSVNATSLGRDTSPLMVAIENRQLEYARELLDAGKDLNFINTEGDTAITKAFAAKNFELVMLILKREVNPVKLETIQRVTDKKQNSPLERAVALGRQEIIKELANYGPGNRSPLEMNSRSCRGQAPLYYGIQCFYEVAMGKSLITGFMDPFGSADEILSAIICLIDDIGVELDVPNENDHTALTFCAELGLTDLAIKLLSIGANPNHRISGGGTALCFAIQNDDVRLVSALLEFKADYTLYVDSLGRPIYTMPMSERLRDLIPYRI